MDTSTKQPAYPFLEVQEKAPESGPPVLSLTQRPFFLDHDPAHETRDASLWRIPVGIKSAGAKNPYFTMLEDRDAVVRLDGSSSKGSGDGWIVVNAGRTGFFRVNYSADMWERLRPAVASKALPTADRLGLGSDAFALMRAGYLPATQFLSLIQAYAQEREYPVWTDLTGSLGWVTSQLSGEPFEPQLSLIPLMEMPGLRGG